jgi:hypothetical protein
MWTHTGKKNGRLDMALVKMTNATQEFKDNLTAQARYLEIENTYLGSVNRDCWVWTGRCFAQTLKGKNLNLDGHRDFGWMNFKGFSRIDGCPVFLVPENFAAGDRYARMIEVFGLMTLNADGTAKHYQKNDLRFQLIEPVFEVRYAPGYKPLPMKKYKQVFSEVDPFGEENWEED